MKTIVVDTNVLLSALISDSKTRELIVNLEHELVAPEAIIQEIDSYRELIRSKSGLNEEELSQLMEKLFKYVKIVSNEKIERKRKEAQKAMSEVDEDDVVFLATALAVEGVIWSDDKDLKQQEKVEVFTTEEVIENIQ